MMPGLDKPEYVVVLMPENQSLDYVRGSFKAVESNLDGRQGSDRQTAKLAEFQGPLNAGDLQIFCGTTSAARAAKIQGFVKVISINAGTLPVSSSRGTGTEEAS
jgi:hypothetical protein